jgi:hypothetical protein
MPTISMYVKNETYDKLFEHAKLKKTTITKLIDDILTEWVSQFNAQKIQTAS